MQRAVKELQRLVHPDRWSGKTALVNAEAFKALGGPVADIAALCDARAECTLLKAPLAVPMVLPSGRITFRLPTDGSVSSIGIGIEDVTRALVTSLRRAKVWTDDAKLEAPRADPVPPLAEMRLDLRNVRVWSGLSSADARTALASIWRARAVFAASGLRSIVFVVGGPSLPLQRSVTLPAHFTPDDVVSAVSALDGESCVA